jgi:Ni2+-binding GTPase involved in maturation of urease and hydrogenase
MKLVTVAGPPSCGKTSVILRLTEALSKVGSRLGVIKFDCLSSEDEHRYNRADIPVKLGLAGGLCPDHFFVANIEEGVRWGQRHGFDLLVCESAGLCNRCSPHIRGVLAVCVVDNLSGVHTPAKIGPMLKTADVVVITKGDVVSQAEREVFAFRIKQVNPRAAVVPMNGLTGQGSLMLERHLRTAPETPDLEGVRLRFSMPAALCSYCLGETRIGPDCQIGNIKTMDFS